jgi:hypothetical protein
MSGALSGTGRATRDFFELAQQRFDDGAKRRVAVRHRHDEQRNDQAVDRRNVVPAAR